MNDMNKIKIKTQKLNELSNVDDLARLTVEYWQIMRPKAKPTIERISNWIRNLKYEEIPLIFKAYKEKKLVGWLLLFIQDALRLEIRTARRVHVVFDFFRRGTQSEEYWPLLTARVILWHHTQCRR